ncbi:MAG TPA: sigma-54 dependent transcriptional regulator, partial [Longimicrobiales bacterium]|nr:sigma-54 dependent transcriptional regulator [Longimicrobiales bacterium]
QVDVAEHAPQALALMEADAADIIISDLSMPAMTGLQLLEEVRTRHPDTLLVLMTAHGDERIAVQALKLGAFDYLPKPFDNDEVRAVVERARELLALRTENARLRAELATQYGDIIGGAASMRELYRLIDRAAPTDVTVLITGESGTGKELVARALHARSRRSRRAFVALNCSAIPAALVESELFGHVRGAFTGADRDRAGIFEAAAGGTLFLDEIGDLAEPAQAKLLRAIEERTITRVGATAPIEVDARVIAATNRPLDTMIAEGSFREDLLYRLAVFQVTLPPLRERREDIAALAVHFTAAAAERHRLEPLPLDGAARRALLAHTWPGNVRELRNAIERALVVADGAAITVADLPSSIVGSVAPLAPADAAVAELPYIEARDRAMDTFDRAFLAAALERHDGNVSATARALGLHRQSLQKMLRRVGLNEGR